MTGPARAEDDDQRAQLGRSRLAGGPRGRQHTPLGQRRRRPGQPPRRDPPRGRLHLARRQGATRCTTGVSPRSSCALEGGTWTRGTSQVDGEPVAGALVDFGLYFFHNAAELLDRGSGPYFYLPKMESHLEARLWNDVFAWPRTSSAIPHGSVRATVLIETIPAAFEMEEILYELRDHASGLNAGRWDYLFSIIKWFRDRGPDFVLPDRSSVGMTAPFMKAYAELLVKTCHQRGAFAIGGMSAFIPSRHDAEVNERAFAQVRADKEREASQGFDGSWVAHPDLVPVCLEAFDEVLGVRPNQLDRQRHDVDVAADGPARHLLGDRRGHLGRAAGERRGRDPLPRVVAARERRRGHPQPHGGRRHGGDLALAAVAVGPQRLGARRRHPHDRRAGAAGHGRGDGRPRSQSSSRPARSSRGWRWTTSTSTS